MRVRQPPAEGPREPKRLIRTTALPYRLELSTTSLLPLLYSHGEHRRCPRCCRTAPRHPPREPPTATLCHIRRYLLPFATKRCHSPPSLCGPMTYHRLQARRMWAPLSTSTSGLPSAPTAPGSRGVGRTETCIAGRRPDSWGERATHRDHLAQYHWRHAALPVTVGTRAVWPRAAPTAGRSDLPPV